MKFNVELIETNSVIDVPMSKPSGENGLSAYEIAVINGFVGTEKEWLQSLNGKDGKDGKDGANGVDGKDGYTPIKGVDYYTESEKQDLVEEITEIIKDELGVIETALDNILAIQNSLIGGAE